MISLSLLVVWNSRIWLLVFLALVGNRRAALVFRLSAGLQGLSLAAEHSLALNITVFDMSMEWDFQREVSRVFVAKEVRPCGAL